MAFAPVIALLLLANAPRLGPVAVLVKVDGSPRFASMVKDEGRVALREAIRKRLSTGIEDLNYLSAGMAKPLADFEDHFDGGKANNRSTWAALTKDPDAGPIIFVELLSYSQKNLSEDALLGNPNKPKSQTKVNVRMWWYDPAAGLTVPGATLTGEAGAGYFGTTDQYELQGSPEAKGLEIRNVNRKRMEAIAKAVWEAVKAQIPKR